MLCNAAAVFAFQESRRDISSFKVSKTVSAPMAMVAQVKTWLIAIADEVVDVRLLMLELLEVSVEISDITFKHAA